MNRTIRLLLLAVIIGVCSAGSGYDYVKPARNVANIGPIVNNDGSTKTVHFFSDPDEHHTIRNTQQRSVYFKQPQPLPYRQTTSYAQVAPQQRRVTYGRVQQQVPVVTYNQRPVTYNQVVPQQKPFSISQQRPFTFINPPAQQRLPFTSGQSSFSYNQVAPQQQSYYASQFVPQQNPISYKQVIPQQQPIYYNQIVPQQIPVTSYQVAPQIQQFQYPIAPVRQDLKVIFVRTPGYEAYTEALLKMAKEAIQSQTIVYVLSKEPDIAELTRRFQEIQATARKMPEVRFIKYKTDDEAVEAQKAIQAQYDSLPGTSSSFGTLIGTGSGSGSGSQTGSINNLVGIGGGDSIGTTSGALSSSSLSSSSSLTKETTNDNEDDLHTQSNPPFLPTGIDVVPGSSYLPPNTLSQEQ